jgi:hypothetical protein
MVSWWMLVHCGLAILHLKSIFKAKEELWEIQIFSPCKKIKINKKSSNKIL